MTPINYSKYFSDTEISNSSRINSGSLVAASKNIPDNECPFKRSIPVQRSIRLSLTLTGAAALALANSPIQPVAAQDDGSILVARSKKERNADGTLMNKKDKYCS